jgi:hypothetical protein
MSAGPIGGGRIQSGAFSSPAPSIVSTGAPSRVATTPTNGPSGTGAAASAANFAHSLPGHATNQSVNGGNRLAGAINSGPQATAGFGAQIGAGGSNKPFIPLDSSKMGLEGLGKIGEGLGDIFAAVASELQKAAKGGGQGQNAGSDGGSQGQNAGADSGQEAAMDSLAQNTNDESANVADIAMADPIDLDNTDDTAIA